MYASDEHNFPYLQTCFQFWLIQVIGYFDAKYSGSLIYNTPLISIDRWQSLHLLDLRWGQIINGRETADINSELCCNIILYWDV